MKYCPQCQTQYSDETLKFCLQDGTPLAEISSPQLNTANYDEAETVISSRPTNRGSGSYQNSYETNRQSPNVAPANYADEPKKSRTGLIVGLTMLAMLAVFGIGTGVWFLTRNNQPEIVKNINVTANTANQNAVKNNNQTVNQVAKTPSPTPKTATNSFALGNTESLSAAETATIKKEVGAAIDGWKSAAEALNLDALMEKYGGKIDYYNKKGVSFETVRADKEKAFEKYDSIEFNVSNLAVTPAADGKHATAVFDKEWNFVSEEDASSGKVKSELQLENLDNKWVIVGEKDLKLYYKN